MTPQLQADVAVGAGVSVEVVKKLETTDPDDPNAERSDLRTLRRVAYFLTHHSLPASRPGKTVDDALAEEEFDLSPFLLPDPEVPGPETRIPEAKPGSLAASLTHCLPVSGQLTTVRPASDTELTLFDRFVRWLPSAMDRHMREMLAGIQLTDEKARCDLIGKLCGEVRLSALGMTETLFEIPTSLLGMPDRCPTPSETAELKRGLVQPLDAWVPSLSFATPCLLQQLGLEGSLALDTSRPHSVRLATDVLDGGEPDVLVLGPRAFLRLSERPNFRNAYRIADRWHSVDARILIPAIPDSADTSLAGKIIYTSGEFSTEQQTAFQRLTAGEFIGNSEGVPTGQIDPLAHLRRAGEGQVMAFAPFAYAAEALGLGRQVTRYPKQLLGQPMFLIFHARLWRDRPRIASLLLARLRHAWLRLATSQQERSKAAENILRDSDFPWACFHGLNIRPLLFACAEAPIRTAIEK